MCSRWAPIAALARPVADRGGSVDGYRIFPSTLLLGIVASSSCTARSVLGSKGTGSISWPLGFFSGNWPTRATGAYTWDPKLA